MTLGPFPFSKDRGDSLRICSKRRQNTRIFYGFVSLVENRRNKEQHDFGHAVLCESMILFSYIPRPIAADPVIFSIN